MPENSGQNHKKRRVARKKDTIKNQVHSYTKGTTLQAKSQAYTRSDHAEHYEEERNHAGLEARTTDSGRGHKEFGMGYYSRILESEVEAKHMGRMRLSARREAQVCAGSLRDRCLLFAM
jgi:hypothetical protein